MSRLNPLNVAITAALGLFTSSHVFAEEIQSYEKLVVTAAGFEQTQAQAPASISVITREELQSRYYRDVTDALRSVPGVLVTGGGDKTDISLRGMSSNYTLMLVDGKRQSSRQTRPNSDGPGIEQGWMPPLQAIERIEVIRGPMSTLYGSDAIGGVINIITRKDNQEWSGSVQLDTVFQENRDSGDQNSVNFFLTGPLADNLSLQVYGQSTERDEDKIERGYQDKSLKSLTSKLNYQLNEQHDLTFEVGTSAQDRRGNVGLSVPTTGCKGGCEDSLNEYRRTYISLSHQGDWGDYGVSDTYVQREVSHNKSREMEIINTVAKSSLVVPLTNNTATVGIEASHSKLEDFTSNKASDLTQIESTQWAAFVEDEWRMTESFNLTLGGRVDHDENYGSHFSPRAYGVWTINPAWILKGGVATGFRSPQLREVTPNWAQVSGGGNIYGNPDLKPETSINKELGLMYQNGAGLNASLTFFHNDFKDKITRVVCPSNVCTAGPNEWGSDPTYRVNVDEAYTRGVESTLGLPITETVYFNASYTFTDSEQKTGKYQGMPLEQQPEHRFSADIDWQATDNLSSWLKLTYRGKESNPVTGPSRSSLIEPAYQFIDTGITYALSSQVSLKGAIYNLLDEEISYQEYGYVEDGRRYWLGIDVNF
ncbi:ligand-gated channel protein [Vibrio ordalii]|uniref:Outer membrane siderophore receptor n=1 Tax=Vibrio ordalii FS-238 TaxID=617133 RepID=A0A853R948_9VIBR|nr:ligand-gated channel protein [Vibrio ordalii]OEE41505.1 outer membrane siderophore receptor [Vibrio ordalii FS-238]